MFVSVEFVQERFLMDFTCNNTCCSLLPLGIILNKKDLPTCNQLDGLEACLEIP